ncbi:hypothetical protein J6590_026904 [Homalodisca vitripennis]|nr:hypothetical protein J6590_026904 [Homalodisca vitripennis]
MKIGSNTNDERKVNLGKRAEASFVGSPTSTTCVFKFSKALADLSAKLYLWSLKAFVPKAKLTCQPSPLADLSAKLYLWSLKAFVPKAKLTCQPSPLADLSAKLYLWSLKAFVPKAKSTCQPSPLADLSAKLYLWFTFTCRGSQQQWQTWERVISDNCMRLLSGHQSTGHLIKLSIPSYHMSDKCVCSACGISLHHCVRHSQEASCFVAFLLSKSVFTRSHCRTVHIVENDVAGRRTNAYVCPAASHYTIVCVILRMRHIVENDVGGRRIKAYARPAASHYPIACVILRRRHIVENDVGGRRTNAYARPAASHYTIVCVILRRRRVLLPSCYLNPCLHVPIAVQDTLWRMMWVVAGQMRMLDLRHLITPLCASFSGGEASCFVAVLLSESVFTRSHCRTGHIVENDVGGRRTNAYTWPAASHYPIACVILRGVIMKAMSLLAW